MQTNKQKARIAGIFYIIMGLTGMFGLMYVPTSIMEPGNAAATAANIRESEFLFRLGIFSQLLCQTAFIFLALSLYRLLKDVNRKHAQLLVMLVVAAVPIAFLATLNQLGAIMVVSGADFLQGFEPEQLNGLMMGFLKLHEWTISIALIFWALWLFPFGYLVYHSRFLPRILGVFLIIGCFAYLVDFVAAMLFPEYKETVSKFTMVPAMLGEFPIMLWLLIMGAKETPSNSQ